MNTKLSIVGLLVLGASLTGCGANVIGTDASSNQSGSSAYIYGQSDGSYNCPSSANVVPPGSSATTTYTACTNTSDASKVKIVGYSATSRMVCVFPLQYNGSHLLYVTAPGGGPLSSCYDAWAAPNFSSEVAFAGTTYNGVLIVDQGVQGQMNSCLISGQNCPAYSFGEFR